MKLFLVIVASGKGKRLKTQVPKQFLKIRDKSILEYSLSPFINIGGFSKIIVTLPENFNDKTIINGLKKLDISLINGGKERQDSVFNALKELKNIASDEDCIFIHDAARPFITEELIQRMIDQVPHLDALIPLIPVTDTIKEVNEDQILKTVDRNQLRSAQTPQVFKFGKLFDCFIKAYKENFIATDDASIFEKYGGALKYIQGEKSNFKITDSEDLRRMKERFQTYRTGSGYDAHQLIEGRDLVLCGVKIPHSTGLLGHSDADVACHALIDALLGAASLGDIGTHFPDSDSQYKEISSLKLLKKTSEALREKCYKIENIDITIIAEKPKLSPYKEEMLINLSETLDISPNSINIKATTTEGLGFEGEEKGISAHSVVCLKSL